MDHDEATVLLRVVEYLSLGRAHASRALPFRVFLHEGAEERVLIGKVELHGVEVGPSSAGGCEPRHDVWTSVRWMWLATRENPSNRYGGERGRRGGRRPPETSRRFAEGC